MRAERVRLCTRTEERIEMDKIEIAETEEHADEMSAQLETESDWGAWYAQDA